MKVAVIGAGPTGLSASLHLVKTARHCDVDLYEASGHVGGFSRSFFLFDHLVDLGPHRFFTQDEHIMRFWLDLADDDCHSVRRRTSILYDKQFIAYPITMNDLLRALPLKTKTRIFSSFLRRGRHQEFDGKNFSSTMRYRFGDVLYELFFKDYTERLWGVPDEELSAGLAYQRIGGFGLAHAIKHAIRGYFRNVDDSFMYPTHGCGQVWEAAARLFQERGGRLHLDSPVESLERSQGGGYTVTTPGGKNHYDHVVSTMPMSRFVTAYRQSPDWLKEQARKLRFRSTVLVYVEVEGAVRFTDQWIYIHSKNIQTGRVTNFSNWGIAHNENRGTHVLCLEYWCTAGDSLWLKDDKQWSELAIEDLGKLGYEPSCLKRTHVLRLTNTYPVITNESESLLTSFAEELNTHPQLQTVGRGGAFKYNNQDHCIEMGLRAAKNVLGEVSNVWSVNSQKNYHENSLVAVKNVVPPG